MRVISGIRLALRVALFVTAFAVACGMATAQDHQPPNGSGGIEGSRIGSASTSRAQPACEPGRCDPLKKESNHDIGKIDGTIAVTNADLTGDPAVGVSVDAKAETSGTSPEGDPLYSESDKQAVAKSGGWYKNASNQAEGSQVIKLQLPKIANCCYDVQFKNNHDFHVHAVLGDGGQGWASSIVTMSTCDGPIKGGLKWVWGEDKDEQQNERDLPHPGPPDPACHPACATGLISAKVSSFASTNLGETVKDYTLKKPATASQSVIVTNELSVDSIKLTCTGADAGSWTIDPKTIHFPTATPSPTPTATPSAERGGTGSVPRRYRAIAVGFVVPRDARSDETASGRFVANPEEFADIPGLVGLTVQLHAPVDRHGRATMEGLSVDSGRGNEQSPYSAVAYRMPHDATSITLRLKDESNPAHQEEAVIPLGRESKPTGRGVEVPSAAEFSIVPVASQTGVALVHGAFGGDAGNTRVTVNGRPGMIIAENAHELFFRSQGAHTGRNRVILAEGGHTASFDLFVSKLQIAADKTTLAKDESTRFQVTLAGLAEMPSAAWKPGLPAQLFDVGSAPTTGEKNGIVRLVITNDSPEIVSIPGSADNKITIALGRDELAGKTYVYSGTITAKQAGTFQLEATIVPLLADFGPLEVLFAPPPLKDIECAHCETAKAGQAMDGPYDDEETCNEKAKVFGTGLEAMGEAIDYCKTNFKCSDPECPKMTFRPPRPPTKMECGCEKVFGAAWYYICDFKDKLRCCCLKLF